jgi:single-strand DNA-binding protein
MEDVNVVLVTGNATADVELVEGDREFAIAKGRIAVNGRKKENGQWVDKVNFINFTVFGTDGENAAKYVKKGRKILIEGRFDWSEWEKDGQKRQAVEIIAHKVRYIGKRPEEKKPETPAAETVPVPAAEPAERPDEQPERELAGVGAGGGEGGIEF